MQRQTSVENIIASLTPIFIAVIGAVAGTTVTFVILSSESLKEEAKGIALGGAMGIVVTALSSAASLAAPLSSDRKKESNDDKT